MSAGVPVVVIRPEPGNAATVAAGSALNLSMQAHPLFAVQPLPWTARPPGEIDALLLGSANALRHAGAQLASYRGKPALCVGVATAEAAQAAGLVVRAVGTGGLQQVLDAQPSCPPRLLRLGGRSHVPVDPPPGVTISFVPVYEVLPQPLGADLQAVLHRPCIVLLHSADAAAHLAAEFTRLHLPRGQVTLASLGPRISAAAGEGWRHVADAGQPTDPALLALAAQLCHDLP
ncbi:uroporphyrinogen-III synthase [Croceibacterium ferulae]|uniref:uroporphyrinogen-III synthase n=1 Tax=Croceibacterium ferulae TaxID=1854641 RepID=UPI000EADF5AB|nr:uroporphyrinogen-III synthase [Croceibacterium ferulae]